MSPRPGVSGAPPDTPCVGICAIGGDGYCRGCLRTLDEIARWGGMDRSERALVYAALAGRRAVARVGNKGASARE